MKTSIFYVAIFICLNYNALAQSSREMITAAGGEYLKADSELNRVNNETIKLYSDDTAFITILKKSEKLWLKQRDADLAMVFPGYNADTSIRSGTMEIYFQ